MSRPVRMGGGCRTLVVSLALLAVGAAYLFKGCHRRQGAAELRTACGRGHSVVALLVWDGIDPEEVDLLSPLRSATPVLASLSEGGRTFQAHSPSSSGTNAAMASLMTGLSPRRHGVGSVRALGRQSLAGELTTMAELFGAAGYRTLAAVSVGQLDGSLSGLDQGFDVYESPELLHPPRWPRSAGETLASISAPFEQALHTGEQVFLLLHCADARDRESPDADAARPFLRRAMEPWRGESQAIAAALDRLAADPQGALEALETALLRRRGDPARAAFVRALHATRLSIMDDALRRVIDAIDRSGRRDDAFVVVTGGAAGPLPAPLRSLPARGDPRPRLRSPLVLRSTNLDWGVVGSSPTRDVDVFATLTGVFDRDGRDLWAQSVGRGSPRDAVLLEDAEFSRRVAVGREWLWCSSIAGESLVRVDGAVELGLGGAQSPRAEGGYWTPDQLLVSVPEARALERLLASEPPLGLLRIGARTEGAGTVGVRARSFGDRILAPWDGPDRGGAAPRAAANASFDLPVSRGSAPLSWTHVRASRRGESLELRLQAAPDPLEPARVFVGGHSLLELDLPLVPDERAPVWPEHADGRARPHAASIERGTGGRLLLSIPGAGLDVRAVLDMVPACDPPLAQLLAVPDGAGVAAHPTRPDAVVLSGRAPLEVTIGRPRKTPNSRLCVTLDLDGRRVGPGEVRYLGRVYGDGDVRLALTATAWNDPRLYDRSSTGGQTGAGVWIEVLDPRPPAMHAAAPDARGSAIIGYLGRSE
ncbi:MAG: sulfatase-like hydrolase/transferase [Planctomycetota bacterium]|nr:sulfatase-like hydrolase/transferase [Planctomycetota bacterium]MDP6761977.1 sulfatase-like hydrolase/transferase [Planctomycetota bacterium]